MNLTNTESNTAVTHRIRDRLAERWPTLFDAEKPLPLAIGIHHALLEAMPDVTATQLRRVLSAWCCRPRYHAALTAGANRYGLESVQGVVTEAQAAVAAEQLKTQQAMFLEKQAKCKAEEAKQAEAKRKKALEVEKAKQAKSPPVQPTPAPAAPKLAGPVIVVKKRRFSQSATDS
jgi:sRNA-binding protein